MTAAMIRLAEAEWAKKAGETFVEATSERKESCQSEAP